MAKRMKHMPNEQRKMLSEEILELRKMEYDGTATEFDLEQLYTLQGEYDRLVNDPKNYEIY